MAEPATAPATPTNGAAQAPPPAPEAAEPTTLADLLENLPADGVEPGEAEPEPTEPAKANGKAKPAKSAPEPAPKSEPEAADPEDALELDEAAFTDEALATRDGVTRAAQIARAAANAAKERNKILDRYDLRLKRGHEALKKDREVLDNEKSTWKADAEREVAPMREAARAVLDELRLLSPHSGANALQRLDALGRLVGADGRQFYEEITLGIASDGKVPPPSRVEQQLRAHIGQLEQLIQQKIQGDEEGKSTAERDRLKGGIAEQIAEIRTLAGDGEKYPSIAHYAGDDGSGLEDVVEWVKATMRARYDAGKPIDKATAIGIVESRLAARSGGPSSEATQVAETGISQSPGSPARGAGKAKTILPNAADRSSGHVRTDMTQEERDAENARDPSLMAAIFGR